MERIICKHCDGEGCSLCDLGEVWEDEQDLQEIEQEREFEVNREDKN